MFTLTALVGRRAGKRPAFAVLLTAISFLATGTAFASFHFMQIEQVIGGVNGDTSAQAIQLRMRSSDQRFVAGAKLIAFDASGANPVVLIQFPSGVPTGDLGSRILAATAAFASKTTTPLTADFTLTNAIPASYLAAGRVVYADSLGTILWSISFGGQSYTGPTTGDTTNDSDGNFGPSFAGPLPSTSTQALLFKNGASSGSTNNAADYALTTGPATFTNNAGASAVVGNGTPALAPISRGSARIRLQSVIAGLISPVDLVSAGDGSGRLFIAEQTGQIRLLKSGQLVTDPFLDVSARLATLNPNYDERGLLGLAFHPGFNIPTSPGFRKLYTYTSEPVGRAADFTVTLTSPANHQSVVAEWQVFPDQPDAVDVTTRREVLRIDEPEFNHNAGQLAFRSTDGYMYIALGDGGAANDTGSGHGTTGNGQNIETVLGKILRIDPIDPALTPASTDAASANGKYRVPATNPFVGIAGVDEIYAYGFRNPYRFSFDIVPTGVDRLIVADVGQDHVEEVDIVEKGKNYGWRTKEGTFLFDPSDGSISTDTNPDPSLINPVLEYGHDEGISVIGGFVYHGNSIPELAGRYVFGDFSNGFETPGGRLFQSDLTSGIIQELKIGFNLQPLGFDLQPPGLFLKGFGRDADGEIYVLASGNLGPSGTSGVVLKIVPLPEVLVGGAGKGAKPRVSVLDPDTGVRGGDFLAQDSSFTKGLPVAVGDVNGDGVPDIVTGVGKGGPPNVKVFDGKTGALIANFLAYAPDFRGGVFVAAGDVNGDGFAEVITGSGPGVPSQVNVYDAIASSPNLAKSFLAYGATFSGGVRVAAGDVDGDGKADIITGAGAGGGPIVSVFGADGVVVSSFTPFSPNYRGGVFVAAGDVNGDGRADIIVGPGSGTAAVVKVLDVANGATLLSLKPYGATFRGGIHVAAGDIDGDGNTDILTSPASGTASVVRAFNGETGKKLRDFRPFKKGAGQGLFIAGSGD